MTNHWVDLRNADVFMVCGSNPSENHTCCWKWMEKARQKRGAKIIVVDPRFTRSAARADVFSFIRPGTDIAFFGGLIKYAIEKNYIKWEYVQNFSNGPILVNPNTRDRESWTASSAATTPRRGLYDKATWTYVADAAGEPKRVQLHTHR